MKNAHIINQLNRIRKLVQAIDTDWEYAQSVGRAQKEKALAAIVELRDAAQKDSRNNPGNDKRADLEAILDQLHDWCEKYGDGYVTMHISTGDKGMLGVAWNFRTQTDQELDIYKEYKKEEL